MRRAPAVAGQFYPGRREALEAYLRSIAPKGLEKEKAIGAICPHAGYMYSGTVAGHVYSKTDIPQNVILLGPNHTGYGPLFSVMDQGEWELPNGVIQVNSRLADKLKAQIPFLEPDTAAHIFEHSLEVQMPFLLWYRPDVKIVPIIIGQAGLDAIREAAEGLARVLWNLKYGTLIVASSDMSHYLPDDTARKKDRLAIERILALDPEGLYHAVRAHGISMCGYIPSVLMLFAARALGAQRAELVDYSTSAEVSGDLAQVVGYAGIVVR